MANTQEMQDLETKLAVLRASEAVHTSPEDDIMADIEEAGFAEVRAPRSVETRAIEERPKTWMPPKSLPDPYPRPGKVHRWIRVSMMGQIDNTNVSSKFREHWTPANRAEYPEITVLQDVGAQFPDGIQVGGLVLCVNSDETIAQRSAYYDNLAQNAAKGADATFKSEEQHPMPIHTDLGRRTQVQFGSGNAPT